MVTINANLERQKSLISASIFSRQIRRGTEAFDLLLNPENSGPSSKIDAIDHWPVPKCKTDVQSFLGMVNVYRRFIQNCAHIASPLTQLTGNVDFLWSETTQSSFENLKRALGSAPVLRTYDPALPITVTTDACGFAIGAVL
jgi:hypothetical protein